MRNYSNVRHQTFRDELLEKINFAELYGEWGLRMVGSPNEEGWVACHGHEKLGGKDTIPSAGVNVKTGVYKDFRDGGKAMSVFDFAAAIGKYDTWQEAQASIAKQYDIKPPSVSKSHPEHGVKWKEWVNVQAHLYCKAKPPITVEGLLRSGAKMCTRFGVPCFAWEIFDANMNVIGYYFTPRSGKPFEDGKAAGAKSIVKKFAGTEMGIIGRPAAEYLMSRPENKQMMYWMEGGPDMLAAYSLWPESSQFLTNPSGCQENIPESIQKLFSGFHVCRVGDSDTPGLCGAEKHAHQLETSGAIVSVVTPRLEISEKHGMDFRDHVHSPEFVFGSPDILMQLPAHDWRSKMAAVMEQQQDTHIAVFEATLKKHSQILQALGLKVLASDSSGACTIECLKIKKRRVFKKPIEMTYLDFLALCGHDYPFLVAKTQADQEENGQPYVHSEVLSALLLSASSLQTTDVKYVGSGIWNLSNKPAELQVGAIKGGSFYMVQNSELVREDGPIMFDKIIDYGNNQAWFDENLLAQYVKKAAVTAWRQETYRKIKSYLKTWSWVRPPMADVAANLVYATWLQSLWSWRPTVSIVGESSSGKTLLMKFLSDLFLQSSPVISHSTVAGVMQSIGYGSLPLLIDEFDTNQQNKFLEILRSNSRGQRVVKGTPTQQARNYQMQHIPWLSGIFSGASDQADQNRIIELELHKNAKYISIPSETDTMDLGYKILASVLYVAESAVYAHQELLRCMASQGTFSRELESLAVPFAMSMSVNEQSLAETMTQINDVLSSDIVAQGRVMSDQAMLLEQLLLATISVKTDSSSYSANPLPDNAKVTLADLLFHRDRPELRELVEQIRPMGFALITHGGEPCLGIHPSTVISHASELRLPEWVCKSKITTLLGRIEFIKKNTVFYLGETAVSGLVIPLSKLKTWMTEKNF